MKSRSQVEREALCRFIELAALAIRASVLIVTHEETPVGLVAEGNAADLGRSLGQLNAALSGLMSTSIPDREWALKMMAKEQAWWRLHLTAPVAEEAKP